MKRLIRIGMMVVLTAVSTLAIAAGEIRLLKAESVIDTHYGLNVQTPRFDVLVANLAFQKQVYVHLKRWDGAWVDVPLSYSRPADAGREVWSGSYSNANPNGTVNPNWDPEFALKYIVNGQTYWDNNGGANYRIGRNSGTLLIGRNVYDGNYRPTAFSTFGQYSSWVTVRNLAPTKQVSVVYTTDRWATTRWATATFSSMFWMFAPNGIRSNAPNPGLNGFEEWNYSLDVGNATRVEYAIRYIVNGQTYWDNNFGRNYVVQLTQ